MSTGRNVRITELLCILFVYCFIITPLLGGGRKPDGPRALVRLGTPLSALKILGWGAYSLLSYYGRINSCRRSRFVGEFLLSGINFMVFSSANYFSIPDEAITLFKLGRVDKCHC